MNKYKFESHGILNRIVTPCTIDVTDYDTNVESKINKITVRALWDTGATVTVLSEDIVRQLGLVPTDISRVSGWDGKKITTNTYNVDLALDNLTIEFVNAVGGPLTSVDMIIGMDVIAQGDLHITHPSFSTLLEFII